MAALMPVISSGANQNPQTILIGTPPSPTCTAEVFASTRKKALSSVGGHICWHEWSVEKIGDVTDWSRVEDTNPALDVRLMRSAVEAEMSAMAPDYFARERLGWWSEQSVDAVIDKDLWNKCATDSPPVGGVLVYAVKFSADGSTGSLAVCLKPDDGKQHVELIANRNMNSGLTWFADWLDARKDKAAQIVVDGMANAQPLIDELLRRGINKKAIIKPKASDMATACSCFYDAIKSEKVTHFNQEQLNDSALKAKKRTIGSDGGWAFADNKCDATMIEAAALAYWGALNTKRKPQRKQRVGF